MVKILTQEDNALNYNKISLFDNISADFLLVVNHILLPKEIEKINKNYYQPKWTDFQDTEILCDFKENLVASYIKNLHMPLQGFAVYRQKIGESKMVKVAEVANTISTIFDYIVGNNTKYQYTVLPITETELGVSMLSEAIETSWNNWSLTSIKEIKPNIFTPEDVWLLDLNISSSDIVQTTNVNVLENNTRYPKISTGTSNYATGNISCMLGNVTCATGGYNEPLDMVERWNEFVASGKQCILKDRKGFVYRVKIQGSPSRKYEDNVGMQPTTISFGFVENGSTKDMSIYKVGDK